MERLEDRCLLAGDLDFFAPLQAEGEGANPFARIISTEVEPNNGNPTANFLPLGFGTGRDTEVDVSGTLSASDLVDVFRVELNAGDILGLNLFGAAQSFSVFDSNSRELLTTNEDQILGPLVNNIPQPFVPDVSPLPRGGNAAHALVAGFSGSYFIHVGDRDITNTGGGYTLETRVFRPVLENNPVGTRQILFLDFNGAVVDTSIFRSTGIASLSPLSTFLPSMGFSTVEEAPLIDAIIRTVEEDFNLIRQTGNNGDFLSTGRPGDYDIEILNSRDHADPWGLPNVSRVIIGGTQGQLGINGILGIAQSLDIGNFDTTETAVVLLDTFSGQVGGANNPYNINTVILAPGASKIEMAGRVIAATVTHEAGHFFGLRHTDPNNAVASLIDTAAISAANDAGVGPDGVFGTIDDENPSLVADNYDPAEGHTGFQDVPNFIAFGLSTGKLASSISGVKFHDVNQNGVRDTNELGLAGWTIFSDLDGDGLLGPREPSAVTDANGAYILAVPPGQHTVREVLQPGWTQTFPSQGFHTMVVGPNQAISNINFGNSSTFGGISGTKFHDLNRNGVFDQGEPGIPGIIIYLDLDGDNRLDLGEPMTKTDANGNYSLAVPNSGTFTVREHLTPGWEQTFPRNAEREHTVFVNSGQAVPNINFGNFAANDFGDAPTAEQTGFPKSYPTLLADDGARHAILPGFHLGSGVDGDPDGSPSLDAIGDDINTTLNDEDGVVFNVASIFPGSPAAEMTVTVATGGYSPGRLNAWIDFNRDGDWDDPGEKVISDRRLGDGSHLLTFSVPANAVSGETYVRVRYGYDRNMKPTGSDIAGEVEDYKIRILSAQPVAVDDQFTINQDSGAVTLDVLLNDLRSLSPPLVVIAAGGPAPGVTAAGGQVSVSANGLGVVYTPPARFFGNDSFSYTIRDGAGNTDSADVSITILPSLVSPFAVDDSFTVARNSTNNQLPVLANDLTGQRPPIRIVSIQAPSGGTATIDNRGTVNPGDDTLVYTPFPAFQGTDQFTYTVQDQDGIASTATVTVHVGDADDDIVRIRLQATNLNGQVISAIGVGEEFNLQVLVADDIRTDDEDGDPTVDRFGVAAAYLDILYNFNLLSLSNRPVTFSADYSNATSFSAIIPGLLDEVGAFQTDQLNPLGRGEKLLVTIPMRASAVGVANFVGDPADRRSNGPLVPPDHDVLLFNPPEIVPIERVRYENTSLIIVGTGGLPNAVDNTFRVDANSINNILDVLANDTELSNPPLRVTAIGPGPQGTPLQGQVVVATNGTSISYTPRTGFLGTEQFTYTVTNSVGLSSQAIVTVRVGNTPNDVNLRLVTTNLAGAPINTITVGSEFKVQAYVQDIRTSAPDPTRTGVFAMYFDLLYNSGLISTVNDPANRFNFKIDFAAPYNSNGLSGNNSFANIIDEIGAFQTGDVALGSSEFLMVELTFRANTPGVANFVADPPDLKPFHDILLYEPPTAVNIDRVNLGFTSLTILGANPEGEFTNPQNHLDVNNDGFVSPIDVLYIFNDQNRFGARNLGFNPSSAAGEGESAVPTGYVDVNGDGRATAIDALLVINHLNNMGSLRAFGEGESSSFVSLPSSVSTVADTLLPPPVSPPPVSATANPFARQITGPAAGAANESPVSLAAVDSLFLQHHQAAQSSSVREVENTKAAGDWLGDDLLDLLAVRPF